MKQSFHSWYASQVKLQIDGQSGDLQSKSLQPVDLRLSVMKPLHAQWIIEAYNYIKNNPELVVNGFYAAGILDKLRTSTC